MAMLATTKTCSSSSHDIAKRHVICAFKKLVRFSLPNSNKTKTLQKTGDLIMHPPKTHASFYQRDV
jgi:hypothetical protein